MRDEHSDFWDDVEADYDRKRHALDEAARQEIIRFVVALGVSFLVIVALWACGIP